ncbi:MAG: hypothetical protein E6I52_28130 [Chloroflexi bacterium]|nr:MAG: hypothetical protein E6I52_28130 [Chloroflexota bacterium]
MVFLLYDMPSFLAMSLMSFSWPVRNSQPGLLSDPVAQEPLDLDHASRFEWTLVRAGGVDEVDRHRLSLEQIVVEPNGGSVLSDEWDIRK